MSQTVSSLKKGEEASTHWLVADFLKGFDQGGRDVRKIAINLARMFGYRDKSIVPILSIAIDEKGNPIIGDGKWKAWYDRMCITSGDDGGFADVIKHFSKRNGKERKGKRTWLQYAQDLIYGWILEDVFAYLLLARGINVRPSGTDMDRFIVPRAFGVSTEPDFIVEEGGRRRYLELQCSLADFEFGNGVIELRNDKLLSLRRHNAILIQFDPRKAIYAIIDTFTDDIHSRVLYHGRFHKIAHDVVMEENNVVTKGFESIDGDINRCLGVDLSKNRVARFSVECGTKEDYGRVNRRFDLKSLIAVHGYCMATKSGGYREDERCDCDFTVFDIANPERLDNPDIVWEDGNRWFDRKSEAFKEAVRRSFKGTSIDMAKVFTVRYDDAIGRKIPMKIDVNRFRVEEAESVVNNEETMVDAPVEFDCPEWA